MSARRTRTEQLFTDLQQRITDAIATIDGGGGFRTDSWTRPEGGGGRSMVLEGGAVIEKGAVHYSCVHGEMSEAFAKELPGESRRFFATGISLILHPRCPHAPTTHANFRYLEKGDGVAWYGGGADLTPYVLYDEDASHFHRTLKSACDRHTVMPYARAKKWCDEYFYLPHRQETRGIGGIFFDYLGLSGDPRGTPADLDDVVRFVQDRGGRASSMPTCRSSSAEGPAFTDEERDWQLVRRGRYVEFNLLYDRGTIFGLRTNGRVESILSSLPSEVRWSYGHGPRAGTPEARLIDVLKQPRDWV